MHGKTTTVGQTLLRRWFMPAAVTTAVAAGALMAAPQVALAASQGHSAHHLSLGPVASGSIA